MAVSSSGGPQDRPWPIDSRLAAEPQATVGRSTDAGSGLDQEVSDHETAALEQAFDLFQQRMTAQTTPFEPLGWSLPETSGGPMPFAPGAAAHPEIVEPPRRDV